MMEESIGYYKGSIPNIGFPADRTYNLQTSIRGLEFSYSLFICDVYFYVLDT